MSLNYEPSKTKVGQHSWIRKIPKKSLKKGSTPKVEDGGHSKIGRAVHQHLSDIFRAWICCLCHSDAVRIFDSAFNRPKNGEYAEKSVVKMGWSQRRHFNSSEAKNVGISYVWQVSFGFIF